MPQRAAFRFRRGTTADLPYCAQMLPPGTRLDGIPAGRLVKLWERLLESEASTFTVIEDLKEPNPRNIEGFGLSAFVTPDFAAGLHANPEPNLSAHVYAQMIASRDILIRSHELAAVNWTQGIDVIILHFALRSPDLSDARSFQVLVAGSSGFYFFHGGYRINTITFEVHGSQAARFAVSGGFQLVKDWRKERPERFNDTPEEQCPHLFMVRRDLMKSGSVNPMWQLFSPQEPVIGFSAIERRLLERALLNQSDGEIAASLDLSMATIKKAWATIFDRVSRQAPYAIPIVEPSPNGLRGPEKRRHLLGYLRTHLEELRPGPPRSLRESPRR